MQFVKSKYLFLWMLFPFVIGITLAYYVSSVRLFAYSKMAILLLVFIILNLQNFKKTMSWNRISWLLGLSVQLFFLVFGFFVWSWHRSELQSNFFTNFPAATAFEAEVITEPQFKNSQLQCLIALRNARDASRKWFPVVGKLKLQLDGDTIHTKLLKFGTVILLPASSIREIQKPKNPYTFDFKKYMFQQGVLHQMRCESAAICISGKNNANIVFRYALNLRQICVKKFNALFSNSVARGIAIALLLGEKSALDEETIQNFQNTGTIHILVISGMHVMYVYLLLWFFLKRLPSKWYFKVLKISIIVLSLAFYTLFTGFTPSVIRAFLMILLYVISVEIHRKNNKYHVLAFAAFVMLIYEPNWMFQLGFQLSFLAVLGILFAFTSLRNFFIGLRIHKYLSDTIAVTLSAQIFVIPLIVYLFHSAPLNFIVSNLLVTFPVIVLMILGVLVLFLPFSILIGLFEWVAGIFNSTLHWIAQIDYLILKDLYISFWELCMLSFISFTFVFTLKYKHKSCFLIFLLSVFCFSIDIEWRRIQSSKQEKIIVYSFYNQYAIAFIQGKSAYVLTDILQSDRKFKNQILPALKHHWVNQVDADSLGVNILFKQLKIYRDTITFRNEKWAILSKNSLFTAPIPKEFKQVVLFNYPRYKAFPHLASNQKVLIMGGHLSCYSEFYVDYFNKNKIKFLDMRKNVAYLD